MFNGARDGGVHRRSARQTGTENLDTKPIRMHTPAPPNTPSSPSRSIDDPTVAMTAHAIRRAAGVARPAPPPYRHRPGHPTLPQQPVPPRAAAERDAGPGTGADGTTDSDAPTFSLTATQVAASMSAAVVAAFIGAQLGVAGTIVGAAIASVVSVVGSAVIGHSLLLTRRKVTQTVHHVRVGAGSPMDADRTVLLTAVTRQIEIERGATPPVLVNPPATGPSTGTPTGPPAGTASDRTGRRARPGRWRLVLVGLAASAAVFAGAIGAVTVVEAVTGAPISGGQSGYSVLGGNGGTGSGDAPSSSSPATATGATEPPATSAPTASSPGSSAPTSTSRSTAPSTSSTTAATTAATTATTRPSTTTGTSATSAVPTTASSAPATTAGAGTPAAAPAR